MEYQEAMTESIKIRLTVKEKVKFKTMAKERNITMSQIMRVLVENVDLFLKQDQNAFD